MENEQTPWWVWLGPVALLGLLAWLLLPWPTDKDWQQVWAAWAQAIGSVAAIVVGAIAVNWQVREQQRHDLRREAKEEFRRVKELHQLLRFAAIRVEVMLAATESHERYQQYLLGQFQAEGLKEITAVLNSIALQDVPGPGLKVAFHTARADFDRATAIALDRVGWAAAHDLPSTAAQTDRPRYNEVRVLLCARLQAFVDRLAEIESLALKA